MVIDVPIYDCGGSSGRSDGSGGDGGSSNVSVGNKIWLSDLITLHHYTVVIAGSIT